MNLQLEDPKDSSHYCFVTAERASSKQNFDVVFVIETGNNIKIDKFGGDTLDNFGNIPTSKKKLNQRQFSRWLKNSIDSGRWRIIDFGL